MRGSWFALLLLLPLFAMGQVSPVEQAIEYLVEFGQTESEEPDLVQLAEQLTYLQNNPVSLNSATADELLEIPLLNSFLVFNLLEYRNRSGRILSYYQLADVKGFTPRLIKILQPFTTLVRAKEQPLLPRYYNQQLALRYRQVLQQPAGYANGVYPGHISENYLRYRLQGEGRLFAGITLQRDPGEQWLPNGYSPDFTSFHLEYRFNKTVKNVVLGDFSAEFGQGLVLWSSLAFNKSADAVTIARFGRGLRHYTGTDENRFLRGGGLTLQLGKIDVAAFYSQHKVDANLVQTATGETVATSLQTSGFHRTTNELADRRQLPLQMGGVHVEWRPQRLRLGLTTVYTQFGYPVQPLERPENALRFSGNDLLHTSLDWKWLMGRMFFFGEAGVEWLTQRKAITAGMQVQAADALQWVLQYRNIAPGWFAAYNAPFSETGRDGEQGVYLGLNWQLPYNLQLALFADHFQYTWLRTNLNRPGTGADYMVQLNYAPQRFTSYVRLRYQIRPQTVSGTDAIREAADANRLSLRWQGNFPVNRQLTVTMRAEWVDFKHATEYANGLLTYLGFNWRLAEKWQVKARYSLFDTDNYDAAIWAYEDDVPYSFSVPAFYNRGTKWYAVLTYQLFQNTEVWFRLAELQYFNQSSIGSGQDAIAGNKRTELKVLLRMHF